MDKLIADELREYICEESWDLDSIADWAWDLLGGEHEWDGKPTKTLAELRVASMFFMLDCIPTNELVDWAKDFLDFYFKYLEEEEDPPNAFSMLSRFNLN